MNYIEIYKDKNNKIEVEVTFDQDTVWLNQYQISDLFNTDRTSIQKHLTNIYKIKELKKNETCAKVAQVQTEGKKSVTRKILYYNLDAVISVGYRVNSKRGVLFRQWATKRLNEHLIKGFTINQKKLEIQTEKIKELKNTIAIISRVSSERDLQQSETSALIDVIKQYTFALDTLDEYDYKNITLSRLRSRNIHRITYAEGIDLVNQLKTKFKASKYFGVEKDKSFNSSISTIFQTFSKKELYPSLEEKSAMLLYLIIKNHSFVDGNKRIAASVFLWFIARNNFLFKSGGEKRISDNELVAICLMIAASEPKEKDLIIKVIIKLIANH